MSRLRASRGPLRAVSGPKVHAIGRVVRQIGRLGFYAHVSVECSETEAGTRATVCGVDDAPLSWQRAAIVGATWALDISGARVACRISTIEGMASDTNPTLVAIAAARAVWMAVKFTPSVPLAAQVEDAIATSHNVPEGGLGLPFVVERA